jgi:hypothetical protein
VACECCSCDPDRDPYPDPYCREFNGPFQRQCDIHNSPGRMPASANVFPLSVQERIDDSEPAQTVTSRGRVRP